MLTPEPCSYDVDNEHLQRPQEEKNEHLRGHRQGLGVHEVPWGPVLEQKKNEMLTGLLYHRLLEAHLLLTSSQKRDKKIAWSRRGRPPAAAPSSFPLPTQPSIFIYRPIWTEMLALLSPGWQPCLLKSEFHLACAKPTPQGEISCWKPGGCWRTVAAVCTLQFSFQEQWQRAL